MDIMSKLGGLRASIMPLVGFLVPLLTLHFLWSLAGIIDDKMEFNQRREMLSLIKIGKKQFELIKSSFDLGQIQINKAQKL